MTAPTRKQLHDACLSYRHDYGILDEEARESLRLTAAKWFFIWQKEIDRSVNEESQKVIDFFLDQLQVQSAKMDGKHHYRFCGGWPMTHCIGSTKDEAVKAAMEEVRRSKEKS